MNVLNILYFVQKKIKYAFFSKKLIFILANVIKINVLGDMDLPKNTIFSPTEAMQFVSGLEFTLTQDLPQEKLAALRQCIEKIHINKSINEIKLLIREVPTGSHRLPKS